MATINKTFSVRNGIDVANTVILSNASGVLNVSNITAINTTTLNVSANIANVGNVLVSQNTYSGNVIVGANISVGNLSVTQNATFGNISMANISLTGTANLTSLNVSGNISNAANVLVTSNVYSGNLIVAANGSFGNISAANISITGNVANAGNVLVTQNTYTGNLSVTANASVGNVSAANLTATTNVSTGNISVTQNVSAGNISAANLTATANITVGNASITQNLSAGNGNFTGGVTIAGNLLVNGSTVTLNSSIVQSNDQYILLTANNTVGDTLDMGFAGLAKNAATGNTWSGLIKHQADEVWHLFDGYPYSSTQTLNTATMNIAQTNVATMNANLIALQITLGGTNVASWITSAYGEANLAYGQANNAYSSANLAYAQANIANAQANNGIYVNGTLVANNPNINFVAANTSNLSIVGTSNTSPGNVTITLDTRNPPGTGGGAGNYEVDVFANGVSVLANANLNFLNSASVLFITSANGTTQANLQPTVNATLNLSSLNVSGNISNTGNLLVSQNTFTGNLVVTQNTAVGNLSVTSGNVSFNTSTMSANTMTIATVSQTPLDNWAATGAYSTAEYLVVANCQSTFHVTKILVVTDGTNVYLDEYSTIQTGGPVGTFTAAITSGNVQLLMTANNATSTVVRTTRYTVAV